jgi:chemotaxis protein CheX
MPECTADQPPYSIGDFLAHETLEYADATVVEIFKLMFGYDISVAEPSHPSLEQSGLDQRTAIVGFSGSMRGSCHIRVDTIAARSIAEAMLGSPIADGDDDSINDALGELCNMLAGGWKNGVRGLSSKCSLSPPTVVSGQNYKVHVSKPCTKLTNTYRFGGHTLHLTLCREEGPPFKS